MTRMIKYVGLKARKEDNVAHTGLVWTQGEVLPVPDKAAKAMVLFGGVWEDVTSQFKSKDIPATEEPERRVVVEEQRAPLPNINDMGEQALRDLAVREYQWNPHPKAKLETIRAKILVLERGGQVRH